jgi:aspartyl-tRNA(Asn)/glutamyl-tRNA(Gln) amidotransferase subunit A
MEPRDETPLWTKSAVELAAGYRAGAFSPTDAPEDVLNRVRAVNSAINAIVTLDEEGARDAALGSELRFRAGKPLGALDGIPMTIKDSVPVAGIRTTWGSRLYADHVPAADDLAVARLRAGGAVILGMSNCPEFTLHGYTDNLVFGTTRNPWDVALTPGGSSGGAAAAVASGLGPVAIGTDAGGSIRRPSSYTGLVGLKPSLGRVPRVETFPTTLPGLEVVGPMARTVADLVAVMDTISGSDARDPTSALFAHRPFAVGQATSRDSPTRRSIPRFQAPWRPRRKRFPT